MLCVRRGGGLGLAVVGWWFCILCFWVWVVPPRAAHNFIGCVPDYIGSNGWVELLQVLAVDPISQCLGRGLVYS